MNIRNVKELEMRKIIVHVIDQSKPQPSLSDNAINLSQIDSKVKGFILEHLKKSINNSESKLAKFESKTTSVQQQANKILEDAEKNFVHSSKLIAQRLHNKTPVKATPGCIVIVLYTDLESDESFLSLIKLDKNDSILYEANKNGDYELIYKGSTLPPPSNKTKLLKFATLRNTKEVSDVELLSKPSLIVLDKQVKGFSRFFYKDFLESEFLLTDEHKSEKLMEGIGKFLKESLEEDYARSDRWEIMRRFASRLENSEEFNVEEAASQILSPYLQKTGHTPEEIEYRIEQEVERLGSALLDVGMGDMNLRGVFSQSIEDRYFKTLKLKTEEGLFLRYPMEFSESGKLEITPIDENGLVSIHITDVRIIEDSI